MATIDLDLLAITTFSGLGGVERFIDLLEQALPEIGHKEREDLNRQARENNWDEADYQIERQILDDRFEHWMPKLSAYSSSKAPSPDGPVT